ncbi:uncharacterized protein B0P05DRAFT_556237 [Gilbertella persicaria]|uniref:uncharacterized protein n=1 Tax=Gilbertella persicaria TaxID=101096 RepID=UPI00221EC66C|nr:uncharacterized protein B0P05DRAFT_556237 [Gilbertella persicaria]KAI8062820.1 hypothetical protein B0P05DRAFT_556237 [Gilbertella persicaria]
MASLASFGDKSIEKDIYAGIVTSLTFHNDSILLVGHGPFLKVYNVRTGNLLTNKCILPANRIHRIVLAPHVVNNNEMEIRQLAVFGSKFISILELKTNQQEAHISIRQSIGPFKDWIMDAQWFYDDQERSHPTKMTLVYGHNNVEIYDFKSSIPKLLYSAQCEVRCILYSARIYGHSAETLIIASGTVFNQVHLWKPHEKNEQDDAVVYKQLIGHEGVIFGVRFNQDASQIISVSDDRTIRLWSLNDEKSKPLVLFGHTARVWDCQFVDDYLVSISEDSTCRVWRNSLNANEDDEDDGDCIACWEGHASKNVWSCAINPENKIVATGGQDSGIRLWSLSSIKNNKIDSEDDLVAFPLPQDRNKDNIRNFVITKDRCIIAATTEGYLLKCNATELPYAWKEIQHDESYRNYAIMKNSDCGRVVVVGNIFGDLVIISPADAFEPFKITAHKQKLFEIFIEPSSDENILYVVSNGYNDSVLFHRLDLSGDKPVIQTLFDLEMPAERTTVMSLGYAEDKKILICGSRESALLVYRLPCHTTVPEGNIINLKPALQLRRSHGKQAITSVLIKKTMDSLDEEDSIVFWTTGRDGCYIQYRLGLLHSTDEQVQETQSGIASQGDMTLSGHDMILEKLYRNRVTKGTLEGSLILDGELLLMGFFRKNFFIYNEKKNFVMVAINCGGGHRRWGFNTLDVKLNKSSFAFIRKEVLYAYLRDTSSTTDGFNDSILQTNYHGREVRAIRFLPLLSDSHSLLFATGGEDTILRIQQYMPQYANKLYTHVNIRKHTTVIKSIDFSQGISSLLFSSGGLEELRCWKVEAQPSKTPGGIVSLNCLEVATCPALSEDIETRIMDTTAFAIDSKRGLHIIGAVYSDAMIRFWLFNETTRKFSLIADGTWHAKCILQITHVKREDGIYFFTSATDGRVAVWDISDDLYTAITSNEQLEIEPTKAAFRLSEPAFHYSVHMSGVNALETVLFGKDVLVVTGGEDNAVSIAKIEINDQYVQLIGKPFIVPHAHASSVTGIKYMDNAVFTTSTDQRLNIWHVDPQEVSLILKSAMYMDVPDPSALDAVVFNDDVHVAITGVGLQSIRYPQQNK